MWECGSQQCISTLLRSEKPLNCCSVTPIFDLRNRNEASLGRELNSMEFFTLDKVVVVGGEDKNCTVIDLGTQKAVTFGDFFASC